MEPFIGQIIMFAGQFAPRGWAFCDGQILLIEKHTALYSILGTMYGGDGRTYFELPDLRGRLPMHFGNGPGLSYRTIGERGGGEREYLLLSQIPPLSGTTYAGDNTEMGDVATSGSFASGTGTGGNAPAIYSESVPDRSKLMAFATAIIGDEDMKPHENMQPSLALNFIIALEGVYPSRYPPNHARTQQQLGILDKTTP